MWYLLNLNWKWEYNYVTRIENEYVKRESNQIKKLIPNQSKTVSRIKSETESRIVLVMVTSATLLIPMTALSYDK